jgi:hypothetical protein
MITIDKIRKIKKKAKHCQIWPIKKRIRTHGPLFLIAQIDNVYFDFP